MERENAKFSWHIQNVLVPRSDMATGAAVRKISIDLMHLVIKAWPVKSGRSRAAWDTSLRALGGRLGFKITKTRDSAAIKKGRSEGSTKIRLRGKKPYVEMTNGVDYAIYLEAGHSGQAPSGVLVHAMRYMRTNKTTEREFRLKWRGVL